MKNRLSSARCCCSMNRLIISSIISFICVLRLYFFFLRYVTRDYACVDKHFLIVIFAMTSSIRCSGFVGSLIAGSPFSSKSHFTLNMSYHPHVTGFLWHILHGSFSGINGLCMLNTSHSSMFSKPQLWQVFFRRFFFAS